MSIFDADGFLILDFQIPPERVFEICFLGPNTFSGGGCLGVIPSHGQLHVFFVSISFWEIEMQCQATYLVDFLRGCAMGTIGS